MIQIKSLGTIPDNSISTAKLDTDALSITIPFDHLNPDIQKSILKETPIENIDEILLNVLLTVEYFAVSLNVYLTSDDESIDFNISITDEEYQHIVTEIIVPIYFKIKANADKLKDLKKCPFCGASAKIVKNSSGYHVECKRCGATTVTFRVGVNAVNNWNMRVNT